MSRQWQFDRSVAKTFRTHAQRHIPDYNAVIDGCVAVCEQMVGRDDAIIDVGCATGNTLSRLAERGFTNLHGVDNSPHMLERVDVESKLTLSDTLPAGPYAAVLMNWTLHFMADKRSYLGEVHRQLVPGGILLLTDKTSQDEVPMKFYHDFKRSQGVSEHEIQHKALAVRDVMHIDPVAWYLEVLPEIGFQQVNVWKANWCFTSFFCVKSV